MTNLTTFYDETTGLVNEEGAVDIIYTDFSKAFDTASQRILREKLVTYGLDEQPVGWIENWLSSQTQRAVVSGMKSRWGPVTSSVSQVSILSPVPFSIFINEVDDVAKCAISKFAHVTACEEQLVHPKVVLSSRGGTSAGWRNRPTGTS